MSTFDPRDDHERALWEACRDRDAYAGRVKYLNLREQNLAAKVRELEAELAEMNERLDAQQSALDSANAERDASLDVVTLRKLVALAEQASCGSMLERQLTASLLVGEVLKLRPVRRETVLEVVR